MANSVMRPIPGLLVWLFLVVSFGPAPADAQAANAQDHVSSSAKFIQDLAGHAVAGLTDETLTAGQREARFRQLFTESFAVGGIARFSLGRYWRGASPAERDEYLKLFEDVIVATWAGQFSAYDGQRVEIGQAIDAKSPRADENAALVRSRIHVSDDASIRVDWRVANKGDIYKITDVLVEGISMVTTQRDEFVAVIRQNGGNMDGLLAMLRERREVVRTEAASIN